MFTMGAVGDSQPDPLVGPYSVTQVIGNSALVLAQAVDSSGNIYVLTSTSIFDGVSSFLSRISLAKLNRSGTVQWSKDIKDSATSPSIVGYSLWVTNAGDAYIVGNLYATSFIAFIIKLSNVDGSLIWQKQITGTSGSSVFKGVTVDSSGNVFAVGYIYNKTTTFNDCLLSKWDANGNLLLSKAITTPLTYGTNASLDALVVTPSGNIYCSGDAYDGATMTCILFKLDSSMTLQWSKKITWASYSYQLASSLKVDSSENVYLLAATFLNSPAGVKACLLKLNYSGVQQWSKVISSTTANEYPYLNSLALDSQERPVVSFATSVGGNSCITVARITYAGDVEFSRQLWMGSTYGSFSTTQTSGALVVDQYNNLYISTAGGFVSNLLKFPVDGSKIGTYNRASFGTPVNWGPIPNGYTALTSSNTTANIAANTSGTVSDVSGYSVSTPTITSTNLTQSWPVVAVAY